ncbi:MAG TPA: class I SAM-dependent methyltransferase [bacterium]|nr:class I SAM-dependent methyltransferase [bacterium]
MTNATAAAADYTTVTETPGIGATREQLTMLYTRYRYAASFCAGKTVLEVACGAGQGLGYLAQSAKAVVGGDIDQGNLEFATRVYKGRDNIELKKIDAHQMPFEDKSFDVLLLYEALYYLEDPDRFFRECRRLLCPGGLLLICTVNREWSDFNPSPFSHRYFSAKELSESLAGYGFAVETLAAFPVRRETAKDRVVSLVKRTAVRLHLMPKTMRGKQFLKRIFLGKLSPLPSEIKDGMAEYRPPVPVDTCGAVDGFKVLFVKATLPG